MGYIGLVKSDMSLFRRRSLIKQFALGAVGVALGGKMSRLMFLTEIQAADHDLSGAIRISLQEFPVLTNELGSLRLGINPIGPDHFPDGNFYPIIINRGAGNVFFALNSECRHASCVVDAFDPDEQGLRCPCHQSLYGIDGSLLQGPAERPLKTYPIDYDGADLLTIQVPGLDFNLTPSLAVDTGGRRFRLSFPAQPSVSYEVRFRQRMTDEWTVVPFSTTPDGPLDQMAWVGFEGETEVFVERETATGFYAVAIQLLEL